MEQRKVVLECIPKRNACHRRRQAYRQLLLWHLLLRPKESLTLRR